MATPPPATHNPQLTTHYPQRTHAYTLVELFVTIAILIIVLGLMVDLANRVRRESADRLARQLLQQLTAVMDEYIARNDGQLPPVTPFIESQTPPSEASLQLSARRNNADFVRYLHAQFESARPSTNRPTTKPSSATNPHPTDLFAGLPLSLYDEVALHDPWGSPIVFMPHQHQMIGMAPNDKFFFFSAGADRNFLTRQDNLYSYEETSMQTYEK